MRQARFLRGGLAVLLAGWVGSAGCIQNYYPVPVTGPGGTVQYGSVCEVPPAGGPWSSRLRPHDGRRRAAPTRGRQPAEFPVLLARSDPDSLATTRVEGNIEEPTLTR